MSEPKISCFRYKRYNDIYVSNVTFSTNELLSIFDIFSEQRVIVLIESNEDYTQALLSISKGMGITTALSHNHAPRFIVVCDKRELFCLLNQANIDNFEGLFIASICKDIISDEFMRSLEYRASSMVKDGISDISISINFPENQMIISLIKEKYAVLSIKNKICNIFGD